MNGRAETNREKKHRMKMVKKTANSTGDPRFETGDRRAGENRKVGKKEEKEEKEEEEEGIQHIFIDLKRFVLFT